MMRLLAILFSIGLVGLCQGLIVPLLAFLLEKRGVSALMNGLGTTAMYLGVIIASPFIENAVRRFGAKRTVMYSTVFCILMTIAFPLWQNLYAWMAIRLLLGIGLSGLFVATEIWLNRLLTPENRGRFLSFYGLFIACGMLIGPQGMNLLVVSVSAPFWISAAAYLIPLLITSRIRDDDFYLEPLAEDEERGVKRWWRIFLLAPFGMCASLVYGYLDGALNGDFPIFGSRIGMNAHSIPLALTIFVLGSIVFQFPLGTLSDRLGRGQALLIATFTGWLGFLALPFVEHHSWLLMTLLFFVGGALGSFYSLGLAYLGDRLPVGDLPTGNVLYTMLYGVGSLLGPSVTGSLISWFDKDAFAWSVASMLFCYVGFGFLSARGNVPSTLVNKNKGV